MVERVLEGHDRDLGALRTDLDALITQLNDRLLPRIDERMDDTERDLTALATGLVRSGREAAATRSRLETLENRVGDLRDRIVRMEQRAGLWRDLQATMARLGDDIDALRTRINVRAAHAPQAAPTPQPATSAVTPAAAAASPVAERLGEGGPQQLSSPDAHSQAS
jgi:chromosome segregation ATPase